MHTLSSAGPHHLIPDPCVRDLSTDLLTHIPPLLKGCDGWLKGLSYRMTLAKCDFTSGGNSLCKFLAKQ